MGRGQSEDSEEMSPVHLSLGILVWFSSFGLNVAAAFGQGDFVPSPKIGLHLVEWTETPALTMPTGFSCNDNLFIPSGFHTDGEANQEYALYLFAADLNPDVGLNYAKLDFVSTGQVSLEWYSDVGNTVAFSGTWKEGVWLQGGGVEITLAACGGTEAYDGDPEGDGLVLLGVLKVSGLEDSRLAIGAINIDDRRATIRGCGESEAEVIGENPFGLDFVKLGAVAFGAYEFAVCEVPAIVHGCELYPKAKSYLCCFSETSCSPEGSVSYRACQRAGGKWTEVRCFPHCGESVCGPVGVEPVSWGRIKSRHGGP